MSEAARELVRRQFEDVFNNQDFSLCEAIFAPGAVEGPAHAREVVEWLRSQFPDLRMTVEAIVAEGDMVAALVRSEGTNTGSLNGVVPPTGRRFSSRQSHWYRVAGGKLAEHWATRDDLPTMIQLGVIQPPRSPR